MLIHVLHYPWLFSSFREQTGLGASKTEKIQTLTTADGLTLALAPLSLYCVELIFFFPGKIYVYVYVYLYVYVCRYLRKPEGAIGSSIAGVTGTCELSAMDPENLTLVLCKSRPCS